MKPGLSVAIITKNEESHIEKALQSVRFADEIVVVDSGSTDSTLDIARKYTDRIIKRQWPGYAAQKNFAMDNTRHEWILSLDADEVVTPGLAVEIAAVVREKVSGFDVYSMPRLSLFIDRWMRHGGWYPDRQLRFLRSGAARFAERKVHESIATDKPVGRLKGDILHYSYESIEDYIARMNEYSSLAATMILEKPDTPRVTAFGLGWDLAMKFLEVYVLKRGFLDGRHGFIVSWLAAYGVFLRQAKVWRPELSPGAPTILPNIEKKDQLGNEV